jgi:hypothetical protein
MRPTVHRTVQAVRLASCVAAYTARVAGQSVTSADVRWSLRHDGPANRRSGRAWTESWSTTPSASKS